MITVKNYQDQKNNVAWSKMPKAVQDTRTDVEEIMEFYDDDADIKETVDIFLKQINDNSKPVGEVIIAKMPKVSKVQPEKRNLKSYDELDVGKVYITKDGFEYLMISLEEAKERFKNNKETFVVMPDENTEYVVEEESDLDWMNHFGIENEVRKPKVPVKISKDLYIVKDGKVLTNHGMKTFSFTDNPEFAHRIEDFDFAERMAKNYDAKIVDGFKLMKSEIENYVPPKVIKTKTPTKTKIAKVIDKTIVDNFSPEFLLIRRFWNIIKSETVKVPFRTVQLLYMAFNKAAVERKVRKVSEAAELFTACNKKIVTLFEDIPNDDKKPYEIEFTDKKLYNEIKEYVSDVAVNPAIPLLKKFIALQNTKPEIKKAETLLKSISNVFENAKDNRLSPELQKAKKELEDYIKKPSQEIEPTVYGLSVPKVCKNRVKCSGLTPQGRLKKGYRFEEDSNNVIRVVKGLGSPKVCKNRVKCAGLTSKGQLRPGYKFIEDTNEVVRVTKAPAKRKPIAKKTVIKKKAVKKKVVAGLGFSDDVEVISSLMPIIPIVNEPAQVIPESNEQVQNEIVPEIKETGPIVKNKLMNMQFDSLDFDNGWENFMQNPAKNMKVAIWGAPKNGKTAGSLQMANYLTKFGKVLYNFADQGFNKSTQDLWQMSGLANNPKAEPNDSQTLAELEKEVATGKYTFVFIDMISDYINKEGIKPYEFKERFMKKYPKVSFILVFEVTKGGNFKGDQGWTHIVDAIVTVENFLMENRGRYGVGSHIVWEEGLKRFNPKKYDEVIEELKPEQLEFKEVERI